MFCHCSTLVITSKQNNFSWIVDLETEQEYADFNGVVSSVNIVSQEQHIALWQVALVNNLLEHVDHVVKLAVDVSNDDDWLLHPDHIWFFFYN